MASKIKKNFPARCEHKGKTVRKIKFIVMYLIVLCLLPARLLCSSATVLNIMSEKSKEREGMDTNGFELIVFVYKKLSLKINLRSNSSISHQSVPHPSTKHQTTKRK